MSTLRAALDHPNVKAFLRVIRFGEGTPDGDGYRRHFGGELFTDFSQHPKRAITRTLGNRSITSTAAGAYQFLSKTWSECQGALGLPDFSPASQDLAAVFLIDRRGALETIMRGDLETAIAKCAKEWASLPGSPYGQPVKTLAQCRQVYEAHGGQYADPAVAPVADPPLVHLGPEPVAEPAPPPRYDAPRPDQEPHEGAPTMVAPAVAVAGTFLWELAKSAISVFAPLAQEKITKEIGRHTDRPEIAEQVGRAIVDTAITVTGIKDPMEAVVTARKDPAFVREMEDVALVTLDKLMPMLDKMQQWEQAAWAAEEDSRRNADARALTAEKDQDEFLTRSVISLFVALLLLIGVLIGVLVHLKADNGTIGTLVGLFAAAGAAVVGALNTRIQHRYGSSRGSAAKDVLNAELARRPKG